MLYAICAASKISNPAIKHLVLRSPVAIDLSSKIATLESNITRLDSSFGRVEAYLFAATILVVVGLVVEYWDDIRLLRKLARDRKTGIDGGEHKETLAHALRAVVGGILVTIGVGWELIEEVQAYRVEQRATDDNKLIVGLLTDEAKAADAKIASAKDQAATATADAALLGVSVGELHNFVADQEKRNSAAIDELKRNTAGLNKARDDAIAAAESTKGDLAKITALLAQENDLRAKIEKLTKPRELSDAQWDEVGRAIKPFAGQEYLIIPYWEMKESHNLADHINNTLVSAGWSYKPPKTYMALVGVIAGVIVNVDSKASPKTKAAAKALRDCLSAHGIETSEESGSGSDHPDMLDITVGAKP